MIDFEYFEQASDPDETAKNYQDVIDFAFFVANFGYSKADYHALTPKEKLFIMKAYENKTVQDSTGIRNAVLNAMANFYRKKGKRFIPLWKKKQQRLNMENAKEQLSTIQTVEQQEGSDWIRKIYQANGWKHPKEKR